MVLPSDIEKYKAKNRAIDFLLLLRCQQGISFSFSFPCLKIRKVSHFVIVVFKYKEDSYGK